MQKHERTVEDYMAKGLSRRAAETQVQLDATFAQVNPRLLEMPIRWVVDDSEDLEEEY